MLTFILRRCLTAAPTLLAVVTLAFFMMHAAPGNPFDTNRKLSPEIEQRVRHAYGLDQPLGVQYLQYIGRAAQGDFGPSLKYKGKTAAGIIAAGFPKSATLGCAALLSGGVLGLALGTVAALYQNRTADYLAMATAILGVCLPTFVTAPLLVLVFASTLGWLPTAGWGGIETLVLPVTVLALPVLAVISRLTRASMIDVLHSDHVRTARAKGLSEWRILVHHAFPGALGPLLSYLGPAAAALITGSLVVEQIFGLPGLGKFFVISALQRDYTVVMAVVVLYAVLILALNLVSEILCAMLDPRIRLG